MTRLGAGSHSCRFVNNITDVCLFLCPLEILRLVRHVSPPVCLSLFVCVRAWGLHVCTYIEEQVFSVVILKQLISANFTILPVHVLFNTKILKSVNVYFTVTPETLELC